MDQIRKLTGLLLSLECMTFTKSSCFLFNIFVHYLVAFWYWKLTTSIFTINLMILYLRILSIFIFLKLLLYRFGYFRSQGVMLLHSLFYSLLFVLILHSRGIPKIDLSNHSQYSSLSIQFYWVFPLYLTSMYFTSKNTFYPSVFINCFLRKVLRVIFITKLYLVFCI